MNYIYYYKCNSCHKTVNASSSKKSLRAKMFDRHFQGILNAILTGSNNARAERINGAIEELKRIGRGYIN
jgi:transposase